MTDKDAIPIYMKVSEKVLHLRRLGMPYATIAERLKINLWMAKSAARWGKTHLKRREDTFEIADPRLNPNLSTVR